MNILLLNLTRFGDLLQSQAAVTDLVRQGHNVALVCLDNFRGAASLLSGPSRVLPLPGSGFLADLVRTEIEDGTMSGAGVSGLRAQGWHRALASLAAWRESVYADFAPDMVCNLTPSIAARLLARFLAQERPCSGFYVDGHGFGLNGNAWASFMQGAALERGVSPFNVVDLFRKIAAVDQSTFFGPGSAALRLPPEEERQALQRLLTATGPAEAQGFVALQLGASEHRRRWPVAFFAELGDILWREEKLCPVLLGSSAERELAERYGTHAQHPFCDLCGKTSLVELASALCASQLLVTNDTGTMHLAAGLGIPLLALFFATAQPFDTGPYCAGSLSLEPDMACHPCAFGRECDRDHACRRAIRPEYAAALVLSRLREGAWRPSEETAGVRAWLSGVDAEGFMDLHSLSGHDGTGRAAWLAVQRHAIRQFLDGEEGEGFRPLNPALRAAGPEADRLAASALDVIRLIGLLRQQGAVLASRHVPMMRERFLGTWKKVHEALRSTPGFAALSLVWVLETQGRELELQGVLHAAERFSRLLECIAASFGRVLEQK